MGFLIVFLGGGIGAALRHGVNLVSARLLGTGFNYATLFENVTGSVIMGLLVGYTAFSAFSLDTILLYQRGELGLAALYVILSVALSVGGLLAGLTLVRHLA